MPPPVPVPTPVPDGGVCPTGVKPDGGVVVNIDGAWGASGAGAGAIPGGVPVGVPVPVGIPVPDGDWGASGAGAGATPGGVPVPVGIQVCIRGTTVGVCVNGLNTTLDDTSIVIYCLSTPP